MKQSLLFVRGLGCFPLLLMVGCNHYVPQKNVAVLNPSWQLIWQDEFNGDELDRLKWGHELNCWGGGNNELQCYTDSSNNSFVRDGKLFIVARKEAIEGPRQNQEDPNFDSTEKVKRDYSSARLRTKHKADWTYGRIEIKAKMPSGQGIWPALWMLPSDKVYGGWPLSGEIDIFEAVNNNIPYPADHVLAGELNNDIHGTLHYGSASPENLHTSVAYRPETNVWESFNRYAIEWEEGEIRWYFNDQHFATQSSEGWFTAAIESGAKDRLSMVTAAPFDQSFHLLMNIAVGGDWPGSPNEQTIFPQQMEVDYVRVYRCSLDAKTGKGCASAINPDVRPANNHRPSP